MRVMRTVDTSGLKCVGVEKVGPWMLGEDKLLRTACLREPFRTLQQARRVFDVYQAAHETSVRTPAPIEVVRVGEGYGVVVEYIRGVGLVTHILLGSYGVAEAGAEVGRLQRTLHQGHMRGGTDMKAEFLGWARSTATLLSPELGTRLVTLVEGVPEGDALLHGDLHQGNVVVSKGELALIDMELAGFGDPIFDLAVSRSRVFHVALQEMTRHIGMTAEQAREQVERYWQAHLEGYFAGASAESVRKVDLQTRLLSELEFCGFTCDVSSAVEKREAVHRLAELVPQVDSLVLG